VSRISATSGWRKSAESSIVTLGRHDQRVDLAEHRLLGDEAAVELLDELEHLTLFAGVVDRRFVDEPPALVRLVPDERLDMEPRERVGILRSHVLDLHAALARQHQQRPARAAVERNGEVVLLLDLGGALDQEAAHDVAADVETEDRARVLLGFVRPGGELHPARPAASAGEHLRLDDDRPTELLGCATGLRGRRCEPPLRHRDAVAAQELLALVLVQVHGGRC